MGDLLSTKMITVVIDVLPFAIGELSGSVCAACLPPLSFIENANISRQNLGANLHEDVCEIIVVSISYYCYCITAAACYCCFCCRAQTID